MLAAALVAPGFPARAQSGTLPALGDSASESLDINEERRVGEEIMRAIRGDPAYLDDPVLQDYLASIFDPLVAAARRTGQIGADIDRPFAWISFLVRDPSVNAFALPGGHVGVHLGLIAMTEHPDELASVLAHELSHVTQRHIARSIGDSQRTGMLGMAAVLLGLVMAARGGNADMAQAAVAGGQAAMLQGQLNYSRDMEREADRIGYGLLVGTGHAPGSMAAMFEKLDVANRLNDSGNFPYLRSHPLTVERIAEARARIPPGAAPEGPTPLMHALMRARATVLMDPGTTAQQRWLQAPADDLPGLYRRALAAASLRDAAAADAALAPLLKAASQPDQAPAIRRVLRWLGAEVQLALRRPLAAAALVDDDDGARPALLLRAEIARSLPEPSQPPARPRLEASVQSLQAWVIDHPEDVSAWWALSQSAQAVGQPVRARRAEAEARHASGDLNGAIQALQAARRLPPGAEAIESHVVESRWRVFEAERRRRIEESRGR